MESGIRSVPIEIVNSALAEGPPEFEAKVCPFKLRVSGTPVSVAMIVTVNVPVTVGTPVIVDGGVNVNPAGKPNAV